MLQRIMQRDYIHNLMIKQNRIPLKWQKDQKMSWGINLSHIIALEIGSFTGITENTELVERITLYPNPVKNVVNIDISAV